MVCVLLVCSLHLSYTPIYLFFSPRIFTRLGEIAWPYVVPHASLALRTSAPILYAKVFGGEL
jgi:hypothetical protein